MTTRKKIKNQFVKALSVFSLVTLSSFSFASNLSNGNDAIIETEKTIKQHISFPNVILPIQKTEKVEVVFTTSENGKVNFVLAKTDNDVLKKQIEKQFSELTLTKIKSNVAYSIVFNIKKI